MKNFGIIIVLLLLEVLLVEALDHERGEGRIDPTVGDDEDEGSRPESQRNNP